jgi:hypothetical protein
MQWLTASRLSTTRIRLCANIVAISACGHPHLTSLWTLTSRLVLERLLWISLPLTLSAWGAVPASPRTPPPLRKTALSPMVGDPFKMRRLLQLGFVNHTRTLAPQRARTSHPSRLAKPSRAMLRPYPSWTCLCLQQNRASSYRRIYEKRGPGVKPQIQTGTSPCRVSMK